MYTYCTYNVCEYCVLIWWHVCNIFSIMVWRLINLSSSVFLYEVIRIKNFISISSSDWHSHFKKLDKTCIALFVKYLWLSLRDFSSFKVSTLFRINEHVVTFINQSVFIKTQSSTFSIFKWKRKFSIWQLIPSLE